jgi:NAD(P)H-dependent FMN reductase
MAHIQIIVGSTRPNRVGLNVGKWLLSQLQQIPGSTYELIDLKEVGLPFLDEPEPAGGGNYTQDHTKQWSKTIQKADGYIWVTPEYNHISSASLINAIHFLYNEWSYKPVAFVGYGGMGGTRAIESLVPVATELRMVPLRDRVHVLDPWDSVSEEGVDSTKVRGKPQRLVEEIVKVSEPLKPLRPM